MTEITQQNNSFNNLPIEVKSRILKFILDNHNENLNIGDKVHSKYDGFGTIVDIFIDPTYDQTQDLESGALKVVIFFPHTKNNQYSTIKLSEFFYHKSILKIETSFEKFNSDIEALCNNSTTIEKLLEEEFGSTDANTTDLVVLNKDSITARRDEMLRKRNFVLVRYERMKDELEQRTRSLYSYVNEIKEQIEKANKLIIQLELYLGIKETMEQIQVGIPADENEPICFRQRILYMDVECGDPSDDGLDFSTIEKFDEWLLSTHKYWKQKNYERLIPEEKCIAVFRIRRSNKEYYYGGNPFFDSLLNNRLNENNKKTYIFIRNGENIYKIWSDIINIKDKLFPSESELTKLFEQLADDRSWKSDVKNAENKIFGFKLHIIFLQGILERTTVFQNTQDLNLFNPDIHSTGKIKFIYDADKSKLLPSHIQPFNVWKKSLNDSIQEGTRIFYFSNWFENRADYKSRKRAIERRIFKEYFNNEYSVPHPPKSGIYTLFKEPVGNKFNGSETLYIKYKPLINNWTNEVRGKSYSFEIDKNDEFIINYDAITLKDLDFLEFYMYTSIGRESYLEYIPLLMEIYNLRKEELKTENEFTNLVLQQNNLDDSLENRNEVLDLIVWWKLKNKWKRSLTVDDTKALRMISKELKKEVKC